ncbi:MAG: hypothetical protein ABL962_17970 [Fimbriimonadaceae bacterium]
MALLIWAAQRAFLRIKARDFSRSTYYGYPPMIDLLPRGTRIQDLTELRRSSFILAGKDLSNYILPPGKSGDAELAVKDGVRDEEDAALIRSGAELIYNAVPRSLYPATAHPWRVYRIYSHRAPSAK